VEGKKAKGFVYFIETQDGQYVKIGYSARVFSRLSQLGTLRPANFGFRLLGCMPGSHQTEAWLHDKFADLRQDGEWFRRAPALDAFIVAVGLVAPRYFPETQQSECPLVAHESRSARRPKEGSNEPAWLTGAQCYQKLPYPLNFMSCAGVGACSPQPNMYVAGKVTVGPVGFEVSGSCTSGNATVSASLFNSPPTWMTGLKNYAVAYAAASDTWGMWGSDIDSCIAAEDYTPQQLVPCS